MVPSPSRATARRETKENPPGAQKFDGTMPLMLRKPFVASVTSFLFVAAVPFLVFAQVIPEIVPERCRKDAAWTCSVCDLAQLAQNGLNAGIVIAVFLGAVLFAYAGWKYVTAGGDQGKAKDARNIFTNVVLGLIIIIAGWLVVDVLMKTLVNQSGEFGPWNRICK